MIIIWPFTSFVSVKKMVSKFSLFKWFSKALVFPCWRRSSGVWAWLLTWAFVVVALKSFSQECCSECVKIFSCSFYLCFCSSCMWPAPLCVSTWRNRYTHFILTWRSFHQISWFRLVCTWLTQVQAHEGPATASPTSIFRLYCLCLFCRSLFSRSWKTFAEKRR